MLAAARPGQIERHEARRLVQALREAATPAFEAVARVAGRHHDPVAPVLVGTRQDWVRFAAASLTAVVGPAAATPLIPLALRALSTRVLGQFDAYSQTPRLMLVAPNIHRRAQRLNLDAHQFARWVCLHEQAHQWQFAAAPWLSAWMIQRVRGLVDTGEKMEDVSAVMALLEGHADIIMDAAGRGFTSDVRTMRRVFNRHRDNPSPLASIVRRVTGLEAKLSQYRDGADFVRTVRARVGYAGLNRVWDTPQHLPTARDIAEPAAWIARVCA